jgi:hypothetical protein
MELAFQNESLEELLVKIGTSNEMYEFPIGEIDNDFTHLYLNQENFEILWTGMHKYLKDKFSNIVAHTFVMTTGKHFGEHEDITKMDEMDYFNTLDALYDNLKNIYFCIVPKDSEDGEMIREINFKSI